jgi:hypothetical protein
MSETSLISAAKYIFVQFSPPPGSYMFRNYSRKHKLVALFQLRQTTIFGVNLFVKWKQSLWKRQYKLLMSYQNKENDILGSTLGADATLEVCGAWKVLQDGVATLIVEYGSVRS